MAAGAVSAVAYFCRISELYDICAELIHFICSANHIEVVEKLSEFSGSLLFLCFEITIPEKVINTIVFLSKV